MSGPNASRGAWARVQLVRGQSGGARWEIDASYPEARLSVGSAPDAGWPVRGIGVMPVHFELFWDGRALWIADTRRVGGVTMNGRPVGDWAQIRGRVEVSFGSAAMLIEADDAVVGEMALHPGQATRVTLAPEALQVGQKEGTGAMRLSSTMAAPAGGSWDDETSLRDEKTRIAGASPESWGELDAERTRIAAEGAPVPVAPGVPVAPSPLAPPGLMRPRLGAGPAAASPGMARTLSQEEMAEHLAAATRVAVDLDVVHRGFGGAAAPASVGFSQGALAPMTPSPPGAAPVSSGFAAGPAAFAAPAPVGAPAVPGTPAPFAPAATGFAAPPSFEQAHEQQVAQPKKKQQIPTRTWILLGVTVLAACGLIMMGPAAQPEPPGAAPAAGPGVVVGPATSATATSTPNATGPAPVGPTGTAPNAAGLRPAVPDPSIPAPSRPVPSPPSTTTPVHPTVPTPTGPLGSAMTPPDPVPSPSGETTAPPAPTEERIAADLVIAGRHLEALPHYERLAAQHPGRVEYAQMVRILRQRLTRQCQGGLGPDGRPCTAPTPSPTP